MKLKYSINSCIFLFTLLLLFSCIKNQNTSTGNATNENVQSKISSLITLKKGDKVELNSPEKFVQIYILFNLEQKKWLNELSANTNTSPNVDTEAYATQYLAEKRVEFFKSFNLTEEQFTEYSANHFKDIDAFLEKNSDYKQAYEDSI